MFCAIFIFQTRSRACLKNTLSETKNITTIYAENEAFINTSFSVYIVVDNTCVSFYPTASQINMPEKPLSDLYGMPAR